MPQFIRAAALLLLPAVLAAPARADLLVTNYINNSVERFNETTGAYLGPFVTNVSAVNGNLQGPAGVIYNPANQLVYVSSQFTNQILTYNLAGTFQGVFRDLNGFVDPVTPVPANTTYAPTVLRIGPTDGNLYVGRNLNAFQVPNPGAGTMDRFSLTTGAFNGSVLTGLTGPTGMLFNAAGDFFGASLQAPATAANPFGFGFIDRRPAGGSQQTYVAGGTSALLTPGGLAAVPGSAGDVAVVDVVGGAVRRFNAAGSPLADLIAPAGALNGQFPSDIHFDPLGRLWVANIGDPQGTPPVLGSVMIFDLNGPTGQVPLITVPGIFASQFAVAPVPEPGTLALCGGTTAAFAAWRRRKQA